MKAFILAAGLGTRMKSIAQQCPKPLLEVADAPLIVHLLKRLRRHGVTECIINTSIFANRFEDVLGDGRDLGLTITYSHEGEQPLETADGLRNALHLLGQKPFLLVNADVYADFDFSTLRLDYSRLAHLVLIENPDHNTRGDFALTTQHKLRPIHPPANHPHCQALEPKIIDKRFTYSGISVITPALLLESFGLEYATLGDVFALACHYDLISMEVFHGRWLDVGTPERLAQLDQWLTTEATEPKLS